MSTTGFKFGKVFNFENSINYAENSIVSKKIISNKGGNLSLFAFDKGEELSEHTAPYDALVQIIDGNAKIILGGVINNVNKGESIIMPANIPHALKATSKFKMILTMIKDLKL